MPGAYLRSLNPRLPLPVWLLQVGGVVNSFGNGHRPAVPRHLPARRARVLARRRPGLVVAVSSAAQLSAGIAAGPLIDRFGAAADARAPGSSCRRSGSACCRSCASPGRRSRCSRSRAPAAPGFWPSQSTLISRLTPAARRHAAFAQQRVTMNLGIGLGGLVGGLDREVSRPEHLHRPVRLSTRSTFLALRRRARPSSTTRASRATSRERPRRTPPCSAHKTFLGLWTLNFLFVAAGLLALQPLPAVRARPGGRQRAPDRRRSSPSTRS